MNTISAIIAAGGSGSRLGIPGGKQLLEINGKPVLVHTIEKLMKHAAELIVVIAEEDIERLQIVLKEFNLTEKVKKIVRGGNTRALSVHAAFKEVSSGCDLVLIHDGARPCVRDADIEETKTGALEYGAAVLCTRVKDTIKQEKNGFIESTPKRSELWAAQTPQVIKKELLDEAYRTLPDWKDATDDVSLVEMLGKTVKIVEGHYDNIKITTKDDLAIAELLLKPHP